MAAGNLYHGIQAAAAITDRVLAFFSGGKDSVCTLDLCASHFKAVQPVFMQLGPLLSFQQAMLLWAEDKYGVEVLTLPHPMLAEWLRYGIFRANQDFDVPLIGFLDVYTYARIQSGIWWIAAGERIADSIVRRAMIKGDGGSVNPKRGRFYPLAEWEKADVLAYIRQRRLKVAPEASVLGFSFRSLMPSDMAAIKKHYPHDYSRLKEWFPFLDVSVAKHEFFGRRQHVDIRANQVPEGRDQAGQAFRD
jgi:phosphoadenosine phosphosulfate reductase